MKKEKVRRSTDNDKDGSRSARSHLFDVHGEACDKQVHQSRLHEAFKAQEGMWRRALEEEHRAQSLRQRVLKRQRLQRPFIAAAIIAALSLFIIGPHTSVGQRVDQDVTHTLAQFTVPQGSAHRHVHALPTALHLDDQQTS